MCVAPRGRGAVGGGRRGGNGGEREAAGCRPASPPVGPRLWAAAGFSEPVVFGGAKPRAQRMAAGRESIPRRR